MGAAGDGTGFCQAEVENFCAAFGEHDVAGLEIAMDDAVAMSALEAVANFSADTSELLERKRAFFQTIGESFTLEIFHDDVANAVLFADVVELADVGMIQGRDGAGFAFEACVRFGFFGEMFGENLDGDGAVEAGVARAVDFAHAACAEAGLNFVGAELGAGSERHWVGGSISHRGAESGSRRR